ncbi:TonB-dependent receptor [Aureisphaera sp. CAU 1614]|uniref:TonB-dependent receptor n=1 Tax=Halomarinibacterium sedimenti TaxID=2857106 RepID=A0A9X1FPN5_9FLAO|nr:TonB-dependent receptor [Halomarinibacterium sedimenti]MBW2938108.1 TonB-dependent receptor [Halomarinibacterium sedimenti]
MRTILFFSMSFLLGTSFLFSQQTTVLDSVQKLDSVYIDTKVSIDRKQSGKTVTVISQETIQQNAGKSVAQVINEVAGFEINGSNSNNGQNLGYFVRGGRNRQVLILVDGVPLNDASQISNDYDLRLVSLANIEKIEVMKGASSVLYGSGAATAVISITTKDPSKKPFAVSTTSMFGTDRSAEDDTYPVESITNNAVISGSMGKFFYQAEANHRYSNGLSAIAAPEGEDAFEADLFNNFNAKVNVGVNITKDITISQFVAFDKLTSGFDDFSYTDANYTNETKQFRTGGHFEWKFKKGEYVFNDNYSVVEREITSSFPAQYDAKVYNFDNYLQYNFGKEFKAIVGLGGNLSKMNSFTIPFGDTQFAQDVDEDTAQFNFFDPYVNVLYTSAFGLNVSTGARMNIHSLYGNHLVYQVNPSYNVDISTFNLKLLGSYSTAYITPSLFQIYDPIYGNEALQPEENTTLEGGFEISNKRFRVSAVCFQREEENFVDFVVVDPDLFTYQYQNTAKTFKASGLEVEVFYTPIAQVTLTANYTNTQADERFALRIPEHKVNASVQYAPTAKTNVGLSFMNVSERDDTFFNPDTFESETALLESYSLLNFNVSHQLTKNLKLMLGVDNILNTDFEELYRYQTKGRNIRLGFGLRF